MTTASVEPHAPSSSPSQPAPSASASSLAPAPDDATWDAFVAASPQGSVFTQSWFLRAITAADPDVAMERLFFFDRDPRASAPRAAAVVVRRAGAVVSAPYPFAPYQSLLLAADVASGPPHRAGKEVVDVAQGLVTALAARCDRLSFCLHPAFRDVRGLQWFRYGEPGALRLDVRYTGLIDLTSYADFDAYLGAVRTTRRQEHKRALARLPVEASRDVGALDALHAATFARQGITRPEHEARLLRALTEAALASGAGELLLCRAPGGAPASATLFVHDARCGYYLFGANAPEHRNLNGGSLLVMEAVRRCRERGLPTVDLCGVNSPQRGDFKTSLGAVAVPYFLASTP